MDMSKLSQGQMIAGVGGVLLILSLFLSWTFGGASAFDLFSGMDIIMLLVGAAAVGYAVLPAIGSAQMLPAQSAGILLLLGVGVLGFVLGDDLEDPYADIGAWLALIACAGIVVGAFEGLGGGRRVTSVGGGTGGDVGATKVSKVSRPAPPPTGTSGPPSP